jgi:hypothetical protein
LFPTWAVMVFLYLLENQLLLLVKIETVLKYFIIGYVVRLYMFIHVYTYTYVNIDIYILTYLDTYT